MNPNNYSILFPLYNPNNYSHSSQLLLFIPVGSQSSVVAPVAQARRGATHHRVDQCPGSTAFQAVVAQGALSWGQGWCNGWWYGGVLRIGDPKSWWVYYWRMIGTPKMDQNGPSITKMVGVLMFITLHDSSKGWFGVPLFWQTTI